MSSCVLSQTRGSEDEMDGGSKCLSTLSGRRVRNNCAVTRHRLQMKGVYFVWPVGQRGV